jgi:glycerol uptake facilitator-like aquaporin
MNALQDPKRQVLSLNLKRFLIELIGSFVIVVSATISIVYHANNGMYGLWFLCLAPAIAVTALIHAFGKISLVHFNPAVTVGFLVTRHMHKNLFGMYLAAQIIGALLGSIFVRYVLGMEAGPASTPDYSLSFMNIIGIEVLSNALLMAVIMVAVHKNGLRGFGGIVIGIMVGLDTLLLTLVPGSSLNPARTLSHAVIVYGLGNLWLSWTGPMIGSAIVGCIYRKIVK